MKILGAKFFQHDSAVCLLDFERRDLFAMSTERVTRIKHDSFDVSPILDAYPDRFAGIDFVCHAFCDVDKERDPYADLGKTNIAEARFFRAYRELTKPRYRKDLVDGRSGKLLQLLKAFPTRPLQVIEVLRRYVAVKLASDGDPEENRRAVVEFTRETLEARGLGTAEIAFFDHHLCHAVASYYFSTFDHEGEILCLTLDGSGDGYFSKAYLVRDDRFQLVGESPNVMIPGAANRAMTSIGEIYTRFTAAMDLYPGSDEGKVEARAAYGKRDEKLYGHLIEMTSIENGCISFELNAARSVYDDAYLRVERARVGDEAFCASVQDWLGDTVVAYLNNLADRCPGVSRLALSGGVAANIIMSLNIYERTPFREIFVLPFMADDGASAGAAILQALRLKLDVSWLKGCVMPYFGDSYAREEVRQALADSEFDLQVEDLGEAWQGRAAQDIHDNRVISLFHGRMEFGPRALGNRSIVANPTVAEVTERINASVKRRPWYQPFCPSILEEERERLFQESFSHKHMAIAFRLKPEFRKELPCAAHVDGTARPQFVSPQDNSAYWELLKAFKTLSGYGVLINTSFNLHGRTIVRTPEDAIRDFVDCGIDVLYIEGFRVSR